VFASCTWCNVLSQLLVHVASKDPTEPFPRCTAYNFLAQKVPRMQQEMSSGGLKSIYENRWASQQAELTTLSVIFANYFQIMLNTHKKCYIRLDRLVIVT